MVMLSSRLHSFPFQKVLFYLSSHPNPTNIIPQRTRSIEGKHFSKNFADNYITPASLIFLHPLRQEWRPQSLSNVQTATSDVLYMVLDHISLIIQNKSGWRLLFRVGAQSMPLFSFFSSAPNNHQPVRCDAHPNDLDAEDTRRRSHQKTEFLITTSANHVMFPRKW